MCTQFVQADSACRGLILKGAEAFASRHSTQKLDNTFSDAISWIGTSAEAVMHEHDRDVMAAAVRVAPPGMHSVPRP